MIYSCVPEDRKLAMPPAGIVRGVAQAMAPIVGPQAQFLNNALMITTGGNLQLASLKQDMFSRAPLSSSFLPSLSLSLSLSRSLLLSLLLSLSLPPFLCHLPDYGTSGGF